MITNYAIIDNLSLYFNNGLNIITGETGAGKSIIMGALGLTLGKRVDSTVLKNNSGKCIIEVTYGITNANNDLITFFKENELDFDKKNIIVRREITNTGKSRSFINDTPVNLNQLRILSSFLIDQHQQFDNLLIANHTFQQEIIDTLCNTASLLKEYQLEYNKWIICQQEINRLKKQKEEFNREYDFTVFQYNELQDLNYKENEIENLEKELKLIENSVDIVTILSKINQHLYEEENSTVNVIKKLENELSHFSIDKELESLSSRLKSTEIELKDIAQEADNIKDKFVFDPDRLDFINDRISKGYRLLKKHGLNKTNELLDLAKSFKQKMDNVFNIDNEIEIKSKEIDLLFKKSIALAEVISQKRKEKKSNIEKSINDLLFKVGMPNARLKINLEKQEHLNIQGIDKIDFLFDANKTGLFESVEKVASGGELSRLMLCIKSLVAKNISLPTLIFDEIDTGISGEAAKQVGLIMKDLSKYIQVISITHQPQIASLANTHYYVYKEENKNKEITTKIKKLTKEERIEQIAQMLSGNNPSETTIKIASEMLEKEF